MSIEQDDETSCFKFMEYLKLVRKVLENEKGLGKVLTKESILLSNHNR